MTIKPQTDNLKESEPLATRVSSGISRLSQERIIGNSRPLDNATARDVDLTHQTSKES